MVPEGAQERIISSGDFFGQNIDALIIKRRESTKKRIKNATKCPHVDAFRIAFVLDNFRSGIANCPAWRHGFLVPHYFRQAEVSDLDSSDATATDSGYKFTLIFLILVIRTSYDNLRGDYGYPFKKQILWLDIPMQTEKIDQDKDNADLKDTHR